jgi:hypothetical protein
MRQTIYPGDVYTWTLIQVANAAGTFAFFPATQAGLDQLQQHWQRSGNPPPDKRITLKSNIGWAKAAFSDVESRVMKYEAVPA